MLDCQLDGFVTGQRHKLAEFGRSIPRKWYCKELLPLVHVGSLCQAVVVVLLYLIENCSVGVQRLLNGQSTRRSQHKDAPPRSFIVLSSALNLEFHHVFVVLVDNLVFDLLFGNAETSQVFLRQVDASALYRVFSDVPQNVGELKGNAQRQSGFSVLITTEKEKRKANK